MPKILIVDDEWLTRLEIEEMLTDLGYDVAGQAETGAEAIAMARELNPDLIVMDVEMPGEMNGIDAARVIKAESGTPIIFITGYGDPEYIEAAKEIAPFGYVMKPFDENEVHAFVEIALSKRELELKLESAHDRLEEANLGLKREIEVRKKTEKALRESEKLYRDIFERNKAVKWLVEPATGKIIDANPAACESYGYSHEEITNLRIWDINLLGEAEMKRLLASAEMAEKTEFTFKHRTASGEIRHVQIFTGHLEAGGKKLLHSIIVDITDRVLAEEKLEETLSQLQATLDATVDGIIVVNLDSKISAFSKRFKKLWNMPDAVLDSRDANQALDCALAQLVAPKAFSQSVRTAVTDPDLNTLDTLNLKDGRILEAYSRPQKINGKMVGRVWSFRDITEHKKAEET